MVSFLSFAWLIPLLPGLAWVLITLTPLRRSNPLSAWFATILMVLSALLALGVLSEVAQGVRIDATGAISQVLEKAEHGEGFHLAAANISQSFRWAPLGDGAIRFGFMVDPAIAVMLAMVALASACIHLFSIGYMAHDPRQARFFSFIALFTAAMLLMLIANNLILFFIAWELMGLCSYLLIGFWYDRNYADPQQITPRAAAIKAFITTRIGDVLLMVGLAYLWTEAGTLEFGVEPGQIFHAQFLAQIASATGPFGLSVATAIALLLFCGTIGKSAQVPLHVWLPDAMEGPTPVSALIHAATMVAAGVFLVARTYPIFVASQALPVVAAIGAFTALFAALIACAQFDIKRILAYSTLSQLGFMVAALGIGGWTAALFHLLTHAFFKALLFLGAGSVIHGMEATVGHDPNKAQDIRNMGGLRRFMPTTFFTYMAGYLALAGIAPFAGFWSKDEILAESLKSGQLLVLVVLLLASLLTAFYMTRQIILVFFGPFRSVGLVNSHHQHGDRSDHGGHEPHESPATMTIPLIVLALFAIGAGVLNLPFDGAHWLSSLLGQEAHPFNPLAAALGTAAALLGIGLSVALYRNAYSTNDEIDPLEQRLAGPFGWLNRRLLVDELYQASIGRVLILFEMLSALADLLIERVVAGFDRLTNFLGRLSYLVDDTVLNDGAERVAQGANAGSDGARRLTTGHVQDYLALIFGGVIVLGAISLYLLGR
ncbi:MAG: NADH-quinone oxidoreductase subunit L [Roseiflexaceae bacterium]